ncbi:MAG: LAGLIDADG family homing endonuclease [bacterium]|nr:LAGLIDADG family homing endonuclease [bacterium]
MQIVYPYLPQKYESIPGVFKIGYYNVELESFFKQKARELLENIQNMGKGFQRTFLRAFFDDEGSVYFIRKRRAVRGYQHNAKILMLIKRLLKNFSIKSNVDEKYNEIMITRKENILRFAKEINFSKGVRVNGNRSNSIWRKSLEKREILRRALASYLKN